MTITFDVLDRFQENNVFQRAQTKNNVFKFKNKMIALSPWKPRPFKLEIQKKYLFDFNHSNYVVKTEFFKTRAVAR